MVASFGRVVLARGLSTLFSGTSFKVRGRDREVASRNAVTGAGRPAVFKGHDFRPCVRASFTRDRPRLVAPPVRSVRRVRR